MRNQIAIACLGMLSVCLIGGCGPDDEPFDCSIPKVHAQTDNIFMSANAVHRDGEMSVEIYLGAPAEDAYVGFVTLADDQTLEVFARDYSDDSGLAFNSDAQLLLTATGEECGPTTYVGNSTDAELMDDLVVRLTDSTGADIRQVINIDPVTISGTPTDVQIGEPFDIDLSDDLPRIVGLDVTESWWFEMAGSCIIDQGDGFAVVEDDDQVGSDQRPAENQTVSATVQAEIVESGSQGCDIAATFVVHVTNSGCFFGNWLIRSAAGDNHNIRTFFLRVAEFYAG